MSSTKKSSAPKKHRRGKVRTVTINPAADDGLGVNITANKAGYVEVAKCHHHSKCKGLKGYCIVAVNQQSFGSGSLVRFSHLSSSLVVSRRLSSSLVVSRRRLSPPLVVVSRRDVCSVLEFPLRGRVRTRGRAPSHGRFFFFVWFFKEEEEEEEEFGRF
jgi:hypothetical protein